MGEEDRVVSLRERALVWTAWFVWLEREVRRERISPLGGGDGDGDGDGAAPAPLVISILNSIEFEMN